MSLRSVLPWHSRASHPSSHECRDSFGFCKHILSLDVVAHVEQRTATEGNERGRL